MTKEVENAEKEFEEAVDGIDNIDPVELRELRKLGEEKTKELEEMGGSDWWLPETTEIFTATDNNNEKVLVKNADKDLLREITIKKIIPIGTELIDNDQYKGDRYLLVYVDIDTGEIMKTPLRGNLPKRLIEFTELTEDLLNRETAFTKDIQKKSAVAVKYWGAIYNKKDNQSYHSYTVKPLRE
jgi:hypothetical protein